MTESRRMSQYRQPDANPPQIQPDARREPLELESSETSGSERPPAGEVLPFDGQSPQPPLPQPGAAPASKRRTRRSMAKAAPAISSRVQAICQSMCCGMVALPSSMSPRESGPNWQCYLPRSPWRPATTTTYPSGSRSQNSRCCALGFTCSGSSTSACAVCARWYAVSMSSV